MPAGSWRRSTSQTRYRSGGTGDVYGNISIGFSGALNHLTLPPLTRAVRGRFPNIAFSLAGRTATHDAVRRLRNGTLDLAFVGLPLNSDDVATRTIAIEDLVPCIPARGEIPREQTTQECYELARGYGEAAERCVRAGIDVLNIHAAHGYLIHQLMSPLSNHRRDEFADPAGFLNLVIDEVRAAAPTVAVGMRVSVIEGTPGGPTADQTFDIVARAHLAKLDCFDLSAGIQVVEGG